MIRPIRLPDSPFGYRCAANGTSQSSPYTSYVAVVGDTTVWNPKQRRSFADIKDGPENTIMLVEVADSNIYWTEPRDLDFDTMSFAINEDRQGISSNHKDGVNVLFCGGGKVYLGNEGEKDCGRVEFLSNQVPPDTLRSLLTINGNQAVPELVR